MRDPISVKRLQCFQVGDTVHYRGKDGIPYFAHIEGFSTRPLGHFEELGVLVDGGSYVPVLKITKRVRDGLPDLLFR
jgi:hypothetical protein